MDIEKIKQQSIVETLEKFKPFENANSLKGFNMAGEKILIDFIDTKLIDYKETNNYYDRHYKVGTKQVSKKLVKELEKLEKAKQSFQFEDAAILNDINQYNDVITNTMKDYCFFAFLYNITEAYFNQVTQSDGQILKKSETEFPEKFYSFYHLMLVLDLRIVSNFESNKNDDFNRQEIENYGNEHYGTGQQFYRDYKKIFEIWHNKSEIAKHLGRNYKTKIIKISGNDHRIIDKLKDYPN